VVLPGLNFVTWVGLAAYAAMCDRGKELAEAYSLVTLKLYAARLLFLLLHANAV